MTVIKEREYLKSIYPNAKWSAKVDRMADDQVLAVYFRLKNIPPDQELPDDRQLRLFS